MLPRGLAFMLRCHAGACQVTEGKSIIQIEGTAFALVLSPWWVFVVLVLVWARVCVGNWGGWAGGGWECGWGAWWEKNEPKEAGPGQIVEGLYAKP